MIRDPQRAQFVDAIASVRRWRDSSVVEWTLLGLVYALALSGAAPKETLLAADSWHGTFRGDREVLTLAGWWAVLISLPLYQFLFARMYYRLVIWWRFLWLVSRIDLNLEPLHADRMGGLRFLSRMSAAFVPLFLAQGAIVAGVIADHIIFSGAVLTDFQEELAAICVLMTVVALAPLLSFQPLMSRARLAGLVKYEALSTRYSRTFDRKVARRIRAGRTVARHRRRADARRSRQQLRGGVADACGADRQVDPDQVALRDPVADAAAAADDVLAQGPLAASRQHHVLTLHGIIPHSNILLAIGRRDA